VRANVTTDQGSIYEMYHTNLRYICTCSDYTVLHTWYIGTIGVMASKFHVESNSIASLFNYMKIVQLKYI